MKYETRHVSVLMGEVLGVMGVEAGDVVVDCTVGLGGHSAELLRRVRGEGRRRGRLIGLDMDAGNIELARKKLEAVDGGRGDFVLVHRNFAAIQTVLIEQGVERVDGVLADLGVASPQIDDAARGFSYRKAGPLDMRMDPSRGQPAWVLVNRLSERELAEAFLELGDEEDAEAIARLIVRQREERPIKTTQELMAVVCQARDFTIQRAAGAKLHPAARTFQALRILVNRELANLEQLLRVLPEVLKPDGVAAIISFHSGEDRRVKKAFKEGLRAGNYQAIAEEPIVAGEEEIRVNARSRSAKLRWARRAGT